MQEGRHGYGPYYVDRNRAALAEDALVTPIEICKEGVTCVAPLPPRASWASIKLGTAEILHNRIKTPFELRVRMPRCTIWVEDVHPPRSHWEGDEPLPPRDNGKGGKLSVAQHIWVLPYFWTPGGVGSHRVPYIGESFLFTPMDDDKRGLPFKVSGNVKTRGNVCWGNMGYKMTDEGRMKVMASPSAVHALFWGSSFTTLGTRRLSVRELRRRQRNLALVARKGVAPGSDKLSKHENPILSREYKPPVAVQGNHDFLVKRPTGLLFTTRPDLVEELSPVCTYQWEGGKEKFAVLFVVDAVDSSGEKSLVLVGKDKKKHFFSVTSKKLEVMNKKRTRKAKPRATAEAL